MVQKNVALAAAAVLAVGFSSVAAAPLSHDIAVRDVDAALYARADKIVKAAAQLAKHVAKDAAHSQAVDAATDHLKSKTQTDKPLPAGASAAISKATGPFNQGLVNSVVSPKQPPKKTRGLDEEDLFIRDFEEDLYARADKIVKAAAQLAKHVAKDAAHSQAVDAATDHIKSKTQTDKSLPAGASAAINKATGPFNQGLVNSVVSPKQPPKKTRGLDEEDLFVRDFEEELYARADKIVKAAAQLAKHVAKDAAHSQAVDAATDHLKSKTQTDKPLPAGASAAINKATGPFNQGLVNSVVNNKQPPKKTHSLEEFLEARWLELEDLD